MPGCKGQIGIKALASPFLALLCLVLFQNSLADPIDILQHHYTHTSLSALSIPLYVKNDPVLSQEVLMLESFLNQSTL